MIISYNAICIDIYNPIDIIKTDIKIIFELNWSKPALIASMRMASAIRSNVQATLESKIKYSNFFKYISRMFNCSWAKVMFTDYVLSENDKSDIRLHQTSLIVVNSLIIIGKVRSVQME